jgi:glutathione S-transferase
MERHIRLAPAVAATLYAVPASHPCAAVERALQLKDLEYRRVDLPPVAHKAVQQALFGGGTVPGLTLDGRRILGSRPIMRALDERAPEPRLVPEDRHARKPIELAEGWGDEVLQPLVRRVLWLALGRAPAAMPAYSDGSNLRIPAPVARLSAPLIARAEQRINAASDASVRADLANLGHHLARVERWMEHDVIGGERPNAADLQIGAGLRLLLTLEDVARAVGSREAVNLARRWFPDYPGRVPAGVLPSDWLR